MSELTVGSGGSAVGAIGLSALVAVLADVTVTAPLLVRVAVGDAQWTGLGAARPGSEAQSQSYITINIITTNSTNNTKVLLPFISSVATRSPFRDRGDGAGRGLATKLPRLRSCSPVAD